MANSNVEYTDSRPMFEAFEPRVLLATQIDSVTMPATGGYLSAAVYDMNDQLLYTIYAREPEPAGAVVPLYWDGIDNTGVIRQSGSYKWKALVSQVEATDQGNVGASSFTPTNGAGDDYIPTGVAAYTLSGSKGFVGGTITMHSGETAFGDTNLNNNNTTLNLHDNDISGSGDFYASGSATMGTFLQSWPATDAGITAFIGHYSTDTGSNKREIIGLEFSPGHNSTRNTIAIRPVIWSPVSGDPDNAYGDEIEIPDSSGLWHFRYDYDHITQTFTARIWNESGTVNHQFIDVILNSYYLGKNHTFNAFGIGTAAEMSGGDVDPSLKMNLSLDNVSYTGSAGVVTFDTALTGPDALVGTNNVDNLAQRDDTGSFYAVAYMQEMQTMQKYGSDGTFMWGQGYPPYFAAAVDGTYEYATKRYNSNPDPYDAPIWNDCVYRFFAQDGSFAPYPGSVPYPIVNANVPDPGDVGMQTYHYSVSEWRTLGNWGIAVDNSYIWVSDYRNNRVVLYNKTTGAKVADSSNAANNPPITIINPLGIAIDPAHPGTAWVANGGSKVTKLTYDGSGHITAGTEITGLNDPTGVAIGGPNQRLYVTVTGDGHVLEYNINAAPSLTYTFGSKDTGGAIADDKFLWTKRGQVAAVAIDAAGVLSVVDDRRIQRFYTITGGGHNAWTLCTSTVGEGNFAPVDIKSAGTNGLQNVFNNGYLYQVDPEYTGGPRAGWLGNGTFKLIERYFTDGDAAAVLRTIGGHKLLYCIDRQSVVIYNVDGAQRRAAMVGVGWMGNDLRFNPSGGRYTWIDSDVDGVIDTNEVTWAAGYPQGTDPSITGGPWVDNAGNIYYTDGARNLIKLALDPLNSFDSHGNPIYSWASPQVVLPYQDDSYGFVPNVVRIDANGDIWAQGNYSKTSPIVQPQLDDYQGVNTGGLWVARYHSSDGGATYVRQIIAPSLDRYWASMAIDSGATSSTDYYFTGEEIFANMFTKDGLLVDKFSPGYASGYSLGWMDQSFSIGAFTSPTDNQLYVYCEDPTTAKGIRYRIDNLNTIHDYNTDPGLYSGTFQFDLPNDVVAHWEFNNNLLETASGTTQGGSWYQPPQNPDGSWPPPEPATTSYDASGHSAGSGSALSVDGNSHYTSIPFTTRFTALTMSVWIKPAALDASADLVLGRCGAAGAEEAIYIIQQGGQQLFQFQVVDAGSGGNKFVTSSTPVSAGLWYHVVCTVSNGGYPTMYVDYYDAQGQLHTTPGVTNTAAIVNRLWPTTYSMQVGPYFHGSVDDLRLYSRVLNSTDVDQLSHDTFPYTVSVSATDPGAAEQNQDRGVFTIKRDGTVGPLTVYYTVSSTAGSGNGSDFTISSNSVVIVAGQSSNTVVVTPLNDALDAGAVNGYTNAVLTLDAGSGYTAGSANAATVNILDDEYTGVVTPTSQWSFEGNTYDVIGHHHANTWYGITSQPTYGPGKVGQALSPNGWYGYVDIPYPDQDSYTVGAWINVTKDTIAAAKAAGPTGITVFARYNGSVQPTILSEALRIIGSNDHTTAYFAHSTYDTDYKVVTDTNALTTPGWYFVAITASSNGLAKLYVNGTKVGTDASIGTLWTGGDRFEIGRSMNSNDTDTAFWGQVDELQIFDTPLTLQQIQTLASACVVTIERQTDASEPSTNGSFIVRRTGSTTNPLTVNFTWDNAAPNSAVMGSDFTISPMSVTILANSSSAAIAVTVLDDATLENTEAVKLNLTPSSDYTIGTPFASISIFDNDTPSVTVSAASDNAAGESPLDTGTFVITRTGSTASDLVINFSMSGSADSQGAYQDYDLTSNGLTVTSSVTIRAGFASQTITLTPRNDTTCETPETATLTIQPGTGYNPGATSYTDTIAITSEDVNSNTITWVANDTSTQGTWRNGSDVRVYGVAGYRMFDGPISLPNGVTVTTNGMDYLWTASTQNVLGLMNPYPATDRRVSVAWQTGPLDVNISLAAQRQVALYFYTPDDTTRTEQIDVMDGSTLLDRRQVACNGTWLVYTGSGNLTFHISTISGVNTYVNGIFFGDVIGGLPTVTITAGVDGNEQGLTPGTFIVSRGTATSGPLTVNYSVDLQNSTATPGADFTVPGSVVIPDTQSSAVITVTTLQDIQVEGNETVKLNLTADPTHYNVGTQNTATINIIDNDVVLPSVTVAASGSPSEATLAPSVFTFTRSNTAGDLTVYYSTANSTATPGTDFTQPTGSVVILNGSSTAVVNIATLDDSANDAGEYVRLDITADPTHYTIGSPSNGQVTIADDDPKVWVNATDGIIGEVGDTSGTFTFYRNNTTGNLTVLYNTTGATAVVGTDYNSIGTSVVILDGYSSATVTVTALDDTANDPGKIVQVNIASDPTHYTIGGGPASASMTITDNDPVVQITNGTNASESPLTNGTFVVSRNNITGDLVVNYTVSLSGTATPDSDYTALSGSVLIPNNSLSATVTVIPINDTDPEAVESVIINLAPGAYTYGTSTSGTVMITSEDLPTVNVTASATHVVEGTPGTSSTFTITRNGPTTNPLTVFYSVTGTAIATPNAGADYTTIGTSVVIAPTQSSATITVYPYNDSAPEANGDTVILTITNNAAYNVGTSSATVYIDDDDSAPTPYGRWLFEDNFNDSAGSPAHNGQIVSGPTTYDSAGRCGKAIDLTGSSNYFQIPDSTDPTAYTISAWVKADVINSTPRNIITRSMGDVNNATDQIVIDANGKFEHMVYDNGTAKYVAGTTTIVAGTWYHVAITASNGGQMHLYVNGQEEGTPVTLTGTLWTGGDRWLVGSNNPLYGLGFFDGKIDDLRVYRTALTQADIVKIGGFAQDGFESGNGSGGTGWSGNWSTSGTVAFTNSGTPKSGTYHMQLSGNNATATRAVNLSGLTSAHLVFDWKANSFEASETGKVEIYNGTSWITVKTVVNGNDDNVYHHEDIDLSSYSLTSSFQVRFSLLSADTNDYFYIDNLFITR